MNGSEGEAAGLLPAQQKPKRVRRRKSREQVIQPIAVDLQAVPPEQAPGVLGLEVPLPSHLFLAEFSSREHIFSLFLSLCRSSWKGCLYGFLALKMTCCLACLA